MKKIKKNIALILAICLMLTALTACSGSSANKDKNSSQSENSSDTSISSNESSEDSESPEAENTAADWEYIESKGELVIGITYFEPMNYLTESGDITGFETEFAQAVCKLLGITAKFQVISWDAKEFELNAKAIDCIWNGMTIDEDRKENMTISQPYMENVQVLVVKDTNTGYGSSVDGLTITAESGSAGETITSTEDFFTNANVIPVDTQSKALLEVSAGTADACVIDYVAAVGMLGENTDYSSLVVIDDLVFGGEEYGIAVRKGEDALIGKINDAINQLIKDGTLHEIAAKYNLEDRIITG